MLSQTQPSIENIGWTLGNDCPFRCLHCYSMSAREKGQNLSVPGIDRIVRQLALNGIKTVNLGGNEPLYTNGLKAQDTLLPYIIQSLMDHKMIVGLTTAGVTINYLAKHFESEFLLLNDVDVSLDSPFEEEHNNNRGAKLFDLALEALKRCQDAGIEHSVVMCGMNWNLSDSHLRELVRLAKETKSNVRINFLKPTEPQHHATMPTSQQFYRAMQTLASLCIPVDMGESLIATALGNQGKGCPCGVKSFRIHSITPDGKVPVSPCVYTHDYRVGDLLVDDLADIITSNEFQSFRERHANPQLIPGCDGCEFINSCRGGCSARSYFAGHGPEGTLYRRDPYCLVDAEPEARTMHVPLNVSDKVLVHKDYLCTYILEPR